MRFLFLTGARFTLLLILFFLFCLPCISLSQKLPESVLIEQFQKNRKSPSKASTLTKTKAPQNYGLDRTLPEGMTRDEYLKIRDEFLKTPKSLQKPAKTARSYVLGDREVFWTESNGQWKLITAECRAVTSAAYIFVALSDNYNNPIWFTGANSGYITQSDANAIAIEFTKICTLSRNAFGNEPVAGLNGESKVTVLLLDIDDSYKNGSGNEYVGGYFYGIDITFSESAAQSYGIHSNERKMLYIDTYPTIESQTVLSSSNHHVDQAYSTIAHEFQHMIHYQHDPAELSWVDEGCSELSALVCGYEMRKPENFSQDVAGNSLIDWTGEIIDYEQVALFFLFLYENYGGIDTIRKIVNDRNISIEGVTDVLKKVTQDYAFYRTFRTWSLYNYIGYYYNIDLSDYQFVPAKTITSYPFQGTGYLPDWSAQYFVFENGRSIDLKYSSENNYDAYAITDSLGYYNTRWILPTGASFLNFGKVYSQIVLVAHSYDNNDTFSFSAGSSASIKFPTDANILLNPGVSYNITWSGFSGTKVTIDLYAGSTFKSTIVSNTLNNRSYSWSIPPNLEARTDYRIKITNTANSAEYDFSDNSFGVAPPLLTYPSNSGIALTPGKSYSIQWSGFSGSWVRIALYRGNLLYKTLTSNTPNDGEYSWTIPSSQTSGNDYKIKISNPVISSVYDLSDSPFSIGKDVMVSVVSVSNVTTGATIDVPVTASQTANLYSCSLQISYASSDLDLVNVTGESGIQLEWKRSSAAKITVSIAKSAGFGSGTPTLCTLRFYVKKRTGSTTVSLNASSLFYGDSGTTLTASLQSGIITISSGTTIARGRGVYSDSAYDVRDALYVLRMATLSPITIGSSTTESPYTSALKYHADVSGDGSVLSNDATLILRYALGINSNLYPLSSAGKTVVTSPTLSLVDQQNTGSSTIRRIAVTLDGTLGIASGDFQISYNSDKVTRATIIQSDLEGMNFECNEPSKGDIRVAMAGANGMESGKKTLFVMELETTGGNESVDVSIRSARLWNEQANEQTAAFENATLTSTATPHAFFLYQNSPNPFNASTVIRFTSTCASRIQLRVYDIRGAVVRTLLNEDRSAGLQSVSWDGRNDRGESVASGVYLFELHSMGTNMVKRMTLMK